MALNNPLTKDKSPEGGKRVKRKQNALGEVGEDVILSFIVRQGMSKRSWDIIKILFYLLRQAYDREQMAEIPL